MTGLLVLGVLWLTAAVMTCSLCAAAGRADARAARRSRRRAGSGLDQ